MKQITELHQHEFDETPSIVVTIPGVYTLLGEFSEFCKGYALCGTSVANLEMALSVRPDQSARMVMAQGNDRKRFNLQNLKFRREDRWGNYIKGVVAALVGKSQPLSGFNMTIAGPLLKHEGSTVSSAIALGGALGLNALFSLGFSREELGAAAYASVSNFTGEYCRSIHFSAMLNAQPNTLLLFDIQHGTHEAIAFPPESDPVVHLVVESRIPPHALREEFGIKRKESKISFERLREVFPNGPLRDIPEQEIKDLGSLLPEDDKRNCQYIIGESKMAREGARLLAQNDMVMYGKVLNKVQAGLRDAFEVTCPEIDWLSKRALETQGTQGAIMINTGSSGTILVLIARDALAAYAARMEEYEHIFGFRPQWFAYKPQGAVQVETVG